VFLSDHPWARRKEKGGDVGLKRLNQERGGGGGGSSLLSIPPVVASSPRKEKLLKGKKREEPRPVSITFWLI